MFLTYIYRPDGRNPANVGSSIASTGGVADPVSGSGATNNWPDWNPGLTEVLGGGIVLPSPTSEP